MKKCEEIIKRKIREDEWERDNEGEDKGTKLMLGLER